MKLMQMMLATAVAFGATVAAHAQAQPTTTYLYVQALANGQVHASVSVQAQDDDPAPVGTINLFVTRTGLGPVPLTSFNVEGGVGEDNVNLCNGNAPLLITAEYATADNTKWLSSEGSTTAVPAC